MIENYTGVPLVCDECGEAATIVVRTVEKGYCPRCFLAMNKAAAMATEMGRRAPICPQEPRSEARQGWSKGGKSKQRDLWGYE